MDALINSAPGDPSDTDYVWPVVVRKPVEPKAQANAAERKAKTKDKTFAQKLKSGLKKINDNLDATFLANLQVGKALRQIVAAFTMEGKTMAEYDQWVIENCDFQPTTASNYERMSEFFHVTHPEILKEVNRSYLRKLGFTLVFDVFSAREAKMKNPAKNTLDKLSWDGNGIYVKFDGSDDLIDLKELTTRGFQKKLKSVGSGVEGVGQVGSEGKGEGEVEAEVDIEVEVDADVESAAEVGVAISSTHSNENVVGDLDRFKKLKTFYARVVTKLNKERKDLRQKLEASQQREKELVSEIEALRAQILVGVVAQ